MSRTLMTAAVLALALAPGIDLVACGDKFFRVGRGFKAGSYAALYPAKILIAPPAGANREFVAAMASMLSAAGHHPSIAQPGMAGARIAGGTFDLVIARLDDALLLRAQLSGKSIAPAVLPVADRKSRSEAKRQFPSLLVVEDMTQGEALREIDRLMAQRTKRTHSAAGAKGE